MTSIDIEQAMKESALNRAFTFTLDMVANTSYGVSPALCLLSALDQYGFEVVAKKGPTETERRMANAVPLHACRANEDCPICGQKAESNA